MSFWQMNFSVGSFLAYWINYACSKNSTKLGNWDWKTVQLFQLLAPILIICAISFCPESPRWLVKKDRTEDAVKALSRVRDDAESVQREISDITRALQFEKDEISSGYSALYKDRSIRKRLSTCKCTLSSKVAVLTSISALHPSQHWSAAHRTRVAQQLLHEDLPVRLYFQRYHPADQRTQWYLRHHLHTQCYLDRRPIWSPLLVPGWCGRHGCLYDNRRRSCD